MMSVPSLRIHPSQLGEQIAADSRRQHLAADDPTLIHFPARFREVGIAGDPDAVVDHFDKHMRQKRVVHGDGLSHGRIAIFFAHEASI